MLDDLGDARVRRTRADQAGRSAEGPAGRSASATRASNRGVCSGVPLLTVERNVPSTIDVTSSAATSARSEPSRAPAARIAPMTADARHLEANVHAGDITIDDATLAALDAVPTRSVELPLG